MTGTNPPKTIGELDMQERLVLLKEAALKWQRKVLLFESLNWDKVKDTETALAAFNLYHAVMLGAFMIPGMYRDASQFDVLTPEVSRLHTDIINITQSVDGPSLVAKAGEARDRLIKWISIPEGEPQSPLLV
jgi:hypothetical protein